MQKIKVILLFFLFTILLMSCNKDDDIGDPIYLPPVDSTAYSFLALGDSYTIGQGVATEERWPVQLQYRLAADSILIDTLTIIAKTGWTTQNLIDNIAAAQPARHDMVSLLIGVNDQYQNKPFGEFTMGFDSLLQIAIQLAGSKSNVMVVSIPDYGVTPFGSNNSATIAEELDAYNAYMAAQCTEDEISFINITEISRELGSSENALADDNLHPSGFQYSKWVEEILPIAKAILED